MAQRKTVVTPLLMHWSYSSLALSHRDIFSIFCETRPHWLSIIGSGNGLDAVRQQAIVWTNVDQVLSIYGITRPQWVNTACFSMFYLCPNDTISMVKVFLCSFWCETILLHQWDQHTALRHAAVTTATPHIYMVWKCIYIYVIGAASKQYYIDYCIASMR